MTQQEILERNKQIALMIGWKEATLEYKLKWCSIPKEEILNRLEQEYIPILMKEGKEPLWKSSLRWHSDWNWLMEAVDFIEKLGKYTFAIDGHPSAGTTVLMHNATSDGITSLVIPDVTMSNKKEAVFIAVSDFAKLYNEKKL